MQNGQITNNVNQANSTEAYLLLQKENIELSEKDSSPTAELL